jgi:hypothetical protein
MSFNPSTSVSYWLPACGKSNYLQLRGVLHVHLVVKAATMPRSLNKYAALFSLDGLAPAFIGLVPSVPSYVVLGDFALPFGPSAFHFANPA